MLGTVLVAGVTVMDIIQDPCCKGKYVLASLQVFLL